MVTATTCRPPQGQRPSACWNLLKPLAASANPAPEDSTLSCMEDQVEHTHLKKSDSDSSQFELDDRTVGTERRRRNPCFSSPTRTVVRSIRSAVLAFHFSFFVTNAAQIRCSSGALSAGPFAPGPLEETQLVG